MSRPQSARERKVGSGAGKTNVTQGGARAPLVVRRRPSSARSPVSTMEPESNQHSTGGLSPKQPPSYEEQVAAAMRTPFYSTLMGSKESQQKRTFLPKSRFPTVPANEPVPASRYRRPPIAPQWFLELNSKQTVFDRADFRTDIDEGEKAEMVDSFIGRNKYRMPLYDYSYKTKSIPEVRESMMNAERFLNQMTTYAYKERTYVSGTSSARMKSLIDQSHQKPVREVDDPHLVTLDRTREQHNERLTRILTQQTPSTSSFSRGYKHAPEYGNFSNFNNILKSNENSVLKR